MNTGETVFLWILIIAFLITGGVLAYDLSLYCRGLETISGHIDDRLIAWRDGGYKLFEFPLLTILLPVGVGMQAVGLFGHLIAALWD